MRQWILLAVLAIIASVTFIGLADSPSPADPPITVKLGPLPSLKLQPRLPTSAAEAKRIKQLIASLAKLDKPDFGLSATLSGSNFLPLPGQEQVATMLLTDHALATDSPLKELVSLGPDALPFLLDALDDQTPTELVINHAGGLGGMWFSNELWLNPVNPSEQAVFRERGARPPKEEHVDSYTVKVGDVCFVAVGQIVGREYSAVRYQPTACIVINSTTHDPAFCAEIRSIWKSNNPRQKLFDSLCADYATRGIFNGTSLDGWGEGSDFECGAAMRLLFYFPNKSTAMLAHRLDMLDVSGDKGDGLDSYMRRCVANQVVSDAFVSALAWSSSPHIRQAISGVFKRAGNFTDMIAARPGVDDKKLVRDRFEALVAALPAVDADVRGDGYGLIGSLIQSAPDLARHATDQYLKDRSAGRCFTVAEALSAGDESWEADVLLPMLSDNRPTKWGRVCDEAASALSQIYPDLKFDSAGSDAARDKQIEAMKKALFARQSGK